MKKQIVSLLSMFLIAGSFLALYAKSDDLVIIKIVERHRDDCFMTITKPDNSIDFIQLNEVFYDKPKSLSANTVRIKEELSKWYKLGYEIETTLGTESGRTTLILRKE